MPETVDKSIYRHHEDMEAIEARRKSKKKDPTVAARTLKSMVDLYQQEQSSGEPDKAALDGLRESVRVALKDLKEAASQEEDAEHRRAYYKQASDVEDALKRIWSDRSGREMP